MARAFRVADPSPMVEMNTTPLIDVMLVLLIMLIMLIITIPIQTHAVKIGLPIPCIDCPAINPISNEVTIERGGTIRWNGVALSEAQLRYQLAATQRLRPVPELHLRPDAAARYEVVDRVLALIKQEKVAKVGFVGNEAYANW